MKSSFIQHELKIEGRIRYFPDNDLENERINDVENDADQDVDNDANKEDRYQLEQNSEIAR